MSEIIPIFPIDVVLYPNQKVPLKIFEPRYRQMLDDCMSSNRVFGINIIDGQKTEGGWASPVKTGTLVYNTSGNGYYNNGGHLNVSTGKFTAPVTGIYHFHFHGFFQASQNNASYEVVFRRINSNGSGAITLTRQYGYRDQAYAQYGPSIAMQLTTSLTAGQTMEVVTSTLSFHGANGYFFGGHLLG